ncbi:MAG TPA: COX15/CtaA family protein [Planctomycetaceae bacterium]|jgi:cytochrome c oxidase assembly protein subunit 15|nr:COX15/CtaA family protein [Planctomycetaceae bacterium]
MQTTVTESPWIHRLAWATALIALLPISVGAVVTTVDAGMAFADWPTSDGHGMLAYPWLKSTGDKFLEHGHRLAGMLIGVMTLGLAAAAFSWDCRPGVRTLVGLILAGVVLQGLLGGSRVIQNERVLALLHGQFAAWIFSLMGLLVAMTGRRWEPAAPVSDSSRSWMAFGSGLVLIVVLLAQYLLGGMLRHLGDANAWLIHPWFAIVVAIAAVALCLFAQRTGETTLARAGRWVVGFVVAQALLGLATWAVKYGFPQWDLVAVQNSSLQVAIRSFHKVLGLLTLMTAFVAVVRCGRAVPRSLRLPVAGSLTPSTLAGSAT